MFGTSSTDYQPIQLYQLNQYGAQCRLLPVCEALRKNLYYYWILHIPPGSMSLPVIPDGATDLVLSPDIEDFSAIYLPVTDRFEIPLSGPICYVGVCMRTERLSWHFSLSIDEMECLQPGKETTDAFALTGLLKQVSKCRGDDAIRSTLDQHFLSHTKSGDSETAEKIFDRFINSLEPESLRTISRQLNVSERQLRRLSESALGLSPKKLHRVTRLQQVLSQFCSPEQTQRIDGFYDDAHLIREFKRLTGLTPGQLKKMAEIYNSSE
ncbi:MAG: AraC family transcriptional regulator [Pseudomonadota bacterium]